MKPVQLVEKLYDADLALRNEITSSLAMPLAGLAALTAASSILITKYAYTFSGGMKSIFDWGFLIAVIAFAVIMIISAINLFLAYMTQEYFYVRLSDQFDQTILAQVVGHDSDDLEDEDPDDDAESEISSDGDRTADAKLMRDNHEQESKERGRKRAEEAFEKEIEETLVARYLECVRENKKLNIERNKLRKNVAALVGVAVICFGVMVAATALAPLTS